MKFIQRCIYGTALVGVFQVALCIGIVSLATPAKSQPTQATLTLTSGVKGGGYHTWSMQAKSLCEDVTPMIVKESDGGPANMNFMEANEADLGLMQADTYVLSKMAGRDLSNVAILMPMFPEAVHVIARSNLVLKQGGYLGGAIGGTEIPVTQVSQIGGLKVAAAGGAQDTMQYMMQASGMRFSATRVDIKPVDLVKAVAAGQYDVAIVTGAVPIGWLKDLDPQTKAKLRLLEVPKEGIKGLNAYKTTSLSYSGFGGQGTVGVTAYSVSSILTTQNWKRGAKALATYKFKQCLIERAEDAAQETGAHPAWRKLKPEDASDLGVMWQPAIQQQVAVPVEEQPQPLKAKPKK